jgi:hypothetical protein
LKRGEVVGESPVQVGEGRRVIGDNVIEVKGRKSGVSGENEFMVFLRNGSDDERKYGGPLGQIYPTSYN